MLYSAARRLSAVVLAAVCTVVLAFLSVPPPGLAAEKPTAAQEELIRKGIFQENENGRPAIEPSAVDEAFAARLYGSPNALGVLQKAFTESAYGSLNRKLGELRQTASLQIWADIASETGLRIELNNAGKTNGALSDLDITFFADADHFPNQPERKFANRSALHDELKGMFEQRWKARFNGVSPDKFDHMHFKGSDVMLDWRASQAHWTGFKARLDADISNLSAEDGAYYIPGAYKPQVLGRYLSEGKAYVLEPDADAAAHGDGFPEGVKVTFAPTRDVSLLYRKTRADPDRTAQLEAILHNHQWAVGATEPVKHAKYSKRETDGLRDLTNLEADFRRLILEGRDQALRYNLDKLFSDYEQKGLLPPEIGSVDEMERVVRMLHQIEFDKVLGASDKPRPKNWTGRWRNYKARNPNAVKTKLETYFKAEAAAIRAKFPDMPQARLAELAEAAFREKARAISRLSAHKAAIRLFGEVFTEDGLRQLRHRLQIKDNNTARRLIVERVRGLHAALVFQDDPRMLQTILDAAPPEAREHVGRIVEIAKAQRDVVLKHEPEVKKITAAQLQESDEVIKKLLVRLGLGEGDVARGAVYRHWQAREADAWARSSRAHKIKTVLLSEAGKAYEFSKSDARAYLNSVVELDPAEQTKNFVGSFWDLGTVDAAAKVTAKLAAGDVDGAKVEARDAVLENVPVAGDMIKLLKAQQAWLKTGDWTPAAKLFAIKSTGSSYIQSKAWGPALSSGLGLALTVYSIEKTLFDLGWYMAGKPTQNQALSMALMGNGGSMNATYDCSGFGGGGFFEGMRQTLEGWKSSRLRPLEIREEEWEAIKSAAILKNIVDIPGNMPREVRDLILKTQYMGPAIREAFACGQGDNKNRTTIIAENYFREIYQRNAGYWLRRALFYKSVHLDFFAWNDRVHPGRNWQLLSGQPPLTGMTKAQQESLKQSMPGVWDPQLKLWDHERYWLRRYIYSEIVAPWRTKLPEVSELMRQAEILTGDFETALVDELVTYYLEGERLDMQLSDAAKDRTKAERQQADAAIDGNADELAQLVLAEQGRRELQKQLFYERLRWAPKLVYELTDTLGSLIASAPEHQPQRPKLGLVVQRPVARNGGTFPFRFFIDGDVTLLPASLDEFELKITYAETGQTLEQRFPDGVNEWDMRWMFGKRQGPEGFDFTQYEVTVTLAYAGDESITLTDTAPIWLAKVHQDEDDAQLGGGELGPEPEDGPMPGDLADEAEGATADVRQRCAQAAAGAEDLRAGLQDASATANAAAAEVDKVIALAAKLRSMAQQSNRMFDDVQDAAQRVVEAKQRAEDLALRICMAAQNVKDTTRAADISADLGAIQTMQRELLSEVDRAREAQVLANRIADELAQRATEAEGFPQRLQAAQSGLSQARDAVAQSRSQLAGQQLLAVEAQAAADELATASALAAQTLENVAKGDERQVAEESVGRISAVREQLQNCAQANAQSAESALEDMDGAQKALDEAAARLRDARGEPPMELLPTWLREAALQSRAAADTADVYAEAVEDLRKHAATCDDASRTMAGDRMGVEARARLRECDFSAATALAAAMPSGAQRADVEGAIQEAQALEREADGLLASARSAMGGQCPSSQAVADLQAALGKTVCDVKRKELADLLAKAEGELRQADEVRGLIRQAGDAAAKGDRKGAERMLAEVRSRTACPELLAEADSVRLPESEGAKTPPAAAGRASGPAASGDDEPPQPFYVVYKFYLYGPRGLSQDADTWPDWVKARPPKGASEQEQKAFQRAKLERFNRWVHSWTLSDVEPVDMMSLSKNAKVPGVFRIDPAAQGKYPREAFAAGAKLASPMKWSGMNPKGGSFNLQGGLLMEVITVYDDPAELAAAYPKFDAKNILPITDEGGMFQTPANPQGTGSGGPLEFGWSGKAQQQALKLSKSIWVMIYEMLGSLDCYVTSVVYGHADAPAVNAFRRLRDDVLRQTSEGRKLSGWYYAVGPRLARSTLGHWSADVLRPALDGLARWIEGGGHVDGPDRKLLDLAVFVAGSVLPEPPDNVPNDEPGETGASQRMGLAAKLATRNLPAPLNPDAGLEAPLPPARP